jgi:hypothetical protein
MKQMISYRSEQLGVVHHLRGPLPVGMDAMDLTSLDARRNIISQPDLPTSGGVKTTQFRRRC